MSLAKDKASSLCFFVLLLSFLFLLSSKWPGKVGLETSTDGDQTSFFDRLLLSDWSVWMVKCSFWLAQIYRLTDRQVLDRFPSANSRTFIRSFSFRHCFLYSSVLLTFSGVIFLSFFFFGFLILCYFAFCIISLIFLSFFLFFSTSVFFCSFLFFLASLSYVLLFALFLSLFFLLSFSSTVFAFFVFPLPLSCLFIFLSYLGFFSFSFSFSLFYYVFFFFLTYLSSVFFFFFFSLSVWAESKSFIFKISLTHILETWNTGQKNDLWKKIPFTIIDIILIWRYLPNNY